MSDPPGGRPSPKSPEPAGLRPTPPTSKQTWVLNGTALDLPCPRWYPDGVAPSPAHGADRQDMIFDNISELKNRIQETSHRRVRGTPNILEDTSNVMGISAGDVLRLDGNDYYVLGEATEGRFGISEQPKFWVKYVVDLTDGTSKLLKLVFLEQFKTRLGFLTIQCTRSPEKESRVLDLVRGDSRFMQGRTVFDVRGNNVRVIERIQGRSLYNVLADLDMDHETYYHTRLPQILEQVTGCIDAIAMLNQNGLMHGDIRNDHIFVERGTGAFRWIDFDYEVNFKDYDIWSMGNILTYVVGKGLCTRQEVETEGLPAGTRLEEEDMLMFFNYRVANLRKIYPYVSRDLNEIITRFSSGASSFYDDCATLARDLRSCTL